METTSGNIQLNTLANKIVGLQVLVGLDNGGNKNYRENYLKATRVPTGFYKITHLFGINTLIKFAEDGRFKLVDHTLYSSYAEKRQSSSVVAMNRH